MKLFFTFEKSLKPLFIPFKQALAKSKSSNWIVYDVRTYIEYHEGSLEKSIHISRARIKFQIRTHNIYDPIILMGATKKSTLHFVRWARKAGYRKIYCSSY